MMRDRDVRSAMLAKLRTEHGSDPDARVIEEMGVWAGTVRIDIAVVNGELCGYELKSDRDTLLRLPRQIEYYGKVFDRVSIVAGSRHTKEAVNLVPAWWGIEQAAVVDGSVSITALRTAGLNPDRDPYVVAELLSKPEALTVLTHYQLAKGWHARRIRDIHVRLSREIPFEELRAHVRAILKTRPAHSRNDVARNLNVPIHSERNPIFKVSSSSCACSDLIYPGIRPTVS